MPSRTANVKVNQRGRCTIPVEVREALGLDEALEGQEEVIVEIEVTYGDDD